MTTIGELLEARAEDDRVGLVTASGQWTWRAIVAAGRQRAAVLEDLCAPSSRHVGVLLPNVPEYLFWLGAAAHAGGVVVGINPTRRGDALAADIRATDCGLLVTDAEGAAMLDGLDHGVRPEQVLVVGTERYESVLTAHADPRPVQGVEVGDDALYLLLFTSGTTGTPKAVRCTQGRLARIAAAAAPAYGYHADDVAYCPMPLFHGNALMALWAPSLLVGARLALRPRFSASGFIDDVRLFGATTFNYVGKSIAYVLATPERPDDADNTLERAFGTEASLRDRTEFQRRFACRLVEGYGQSEGGSTITVVPGTPPGSLGRPAGTMDIAVLDPETGAECPRAVFDDRGRLCNAEEATGEIVNRSGIGSFEGYYKNPEADAERTRNGWYWTGDLAYRDQEGWFYFAGRRGDWLRVDSENFAAGPVENLLSRFPDAAGAAVYPVPDTRSGDQVMVAFELRPGATFDPTGFSAWLDQQPELGTKWAPRYVRICTTIPQTATGKVTKVGLRAEGWTCADPVWWRPERDAHYRLLTAADRDALAAERERYRAAG